MPNTMKQAVRYGRDSLERSVKYASVNEREEAFAQLMKARHYVWEAEVAYVTALREEGLTWREVSEVCQKPHPWAWEQYARAVKDLQMFRAMERAGTSDADS